MADNSHAQSVTLKRARLRLRPFFSASHAICETEDQRREHLVLQFGDYPHVKLSDTSNGEREPE